MSREYKDFYWLNNDSISFLKKGYLEEKYLDNPIKRYEDLAFSAEKILKKKGFAEKFLGYLAKGYYSISSPVTSNFGNKRGYPISCFGNYIEDEMFDILNNHAEVGMMTKYGGGTSAYFGDLRHSGAPLSMGGISSGPVHFMSLFDRVANVVSQSSIRRGAFAAYLDVDHPDFLDFLKIKSEGHFIQDMSFGACISDDFMKRIKSGDTKSRKIWAEIIKKRFASGYPYIFFTDNVNNNAPKVYKDKGLKIHASNLCVAGDQVVATKNGLRTVYDLYNSEEDLELFDGFKYVKASKMERIQTNSHLVKVILKNGLNHKVTLDHKIKTKDGIKRAIELKEGDMVAIQSVPLDISHLKSFEDFLNFIDARSYLEWIDIDILLNIYKIAESISKYKMGEEPHLKYHSSSFLVSEYMAEFVCIVLNTFGINYTTKIGKAIYGKYKSEFCSEANRGANESLNHNVFFEIEFDANSLESIHQKYAKVLRVEYAGTEDVYCCKVDTDEHLWVCNGVITHNCSEIALHSSREESFVCCLSSINLLHWEEIKDTDAVETLVFFLDAVISEFIEKSDKDPIMKKANLFARKQRAIGLGVLGYHSYLQSKMIPFESMSAKMKNAEIFSTIRAKCDETNIKLAEKYGEPYLLQGYGQRCVTTMAIAPTVSSSMILGQVSQGIEPIYDNYHIKNTAKGDYTKRNSFFFELLESKGQNTQENIDSLLKNGGSCQHFNFLTKEEKDVFKTFDEISQAEIVTQAAQRQKWIDQSQSLNLRIPSWASPKDVSNLLISGWEMGVKTFYYQLGSNLAQEASRDLFKCSSCEG